MKAYRFDPKLDFPGLTPSEETPAAPQRGELLIRVRAVSLNYRDIALAEGTYLSPQRPGLVPISAGAGEVVEVGEGVEEYAPGDRVMGIFAARWFGGARRQAVANNTYGNIEDGWLMEYKVVSREAVVRIPDTLSYEQAATLPCAGVTALNALSGDTPIRAGDTVLTLGSGGVSLFALQLARAFGARVIATTSTAEKAERLKAMGASDVVNYREDDSWGETVRELTGGEGVERIVEVGGPATIGQSLNAIGIDQELVVIGFIGGEGAPIDYFDLMKSGVRIRSISVGDRTMLEALAHLVEVKKIEPVIDHVFDFDQAAEAFQYMKEARHFGKVVIKI